MKAWIHATAAALACSLSAAASEVDDALAWFETLGLPNTAGLPCVYVATGLPIQRGNQPMENRRTRGFLVDDDGAAFSVYICDFPENTPGVEEPFWPNTVVRFTRKASDKSYAIVGYEKIDFETSAKDAWNRLQKLQASDEFHWPPREERGRIFALGRACRQNGLDALADDFFTAAKAIPSRQDPPPRDLREALQQDMAEGAMWRTHEKFYDLKISRGQLAGEFESIARNYPASRRAKEARESAALLRQMEREDAEHEPKPIEKPPVDDQVAELVFRLRDLHAFEWGSTGYGPARPTGDGKDAASRLIDIGYPAVPRLIEVLDDERFTRSFVPTIHGEAEPAPMRVGMAAWWILDGIAGRHFNVPRDEKGRPVNGVTLRKVVEDWWRGLQEDGAENTLIAATAAGDERSASSARKLADSHPEAALDAIAKGIAAAKIPGWRKPLIDVAASLEGDASADLLRAEVESDHDILSRTAAAEALIARGHREAVDAMIEAWNACQPALAGDQTTPPDDMNALAPYEQVGGLITLLANCGDPRAVEALHEDFSTAPIDVRIAIIQALAPQAANFGMFATGRTIHIGNFHSRSDNEESGAACERLLVDALDDRARRTDMTLTWDEASFKDPRVCDLAALFLAKRWPGIYRFDANADLAARDREIDGMKAVASARVSP